MTTTIQQTRNHLLDIEGMTCASCVRRVEEALSEIDGVEQAVVNLATEQATVSTSRDIDVPTLLDAVERTGYTAKSRNPEPGPAARPVSREISLNIQGTTCASCVGRVEKALNSVSGVASAAVNLATERATLTTDRNNPVDELLTALEKAGQSKVR